MLVAAEDREVKHAGAEMKEDTIPGGGGIRYDSTVGGTVT